MRVIMDKEEEILTRREEVGGGIGQPSWWQPNGILIV